jgi:hypothetical protein
MVEKRLRKFHSSIPFISLLSLSFLVEFPGFAKEGENLLKSAGIKEGLTVTKYGSETSVTFTGINF